MSKNESSIFKNTAFVFIDSNVTEEKGKLPERVDEFYFRTNDFSNMVADEIIKKYKEELKICKPEQVILAGHSLAAYPVLDIAAKHPNEIGGVILISPALNQNKSHALPESPEQPMKELPIYLQIGQLEDAKLPLCVSMKRDMKDQSRLDANRDFHEFLRKNHYNTSDTLSIHPYGHSGIHAVQGLQDGLSYIREQQIQEHQPEPTTPRR